MKLVNGTRLYFAENPNNKGTLGFFINSPFIYYKGNGYKCSIRFEGSKMIISDLIRAKSGTNRITEHLFKMQEGKIFLEQKVSILRRNWILYNMNLHTLNRRNLKFRRTVISRRRTIQAFSVAIIGCLIYLFTNLMNENWLKNLIADNIYIQTFLIFMSLISIMRLWRPFSVVKGINEDDIKRIAAEVYEKNKENEEIENSATF